MSDSLVLFYSNDVVQTLFHVLHIGYPSWRASIEQKPDRRLGRTTGLSPICEARIGPEGPLGFY